MQNGRQRGTAALIDALVLRLSAEFQGFARDLHDEVCDVFAAWIAPSNTPAQNVVRSRLREDRAIDRGNVHPGSLGKDFGRFGFGIWPALAVRDPMTSTHNRSLARLNTARNALAHADDSRLAELRTAGFPLGQPSFRRWRRDLDTLATNLDTEMSIQLARLFSRQPPW